MPPRIRRMTTGRLQEDTPAVIKPIIVEKVVNTESLNIRRNPDGEAFCQLKQNTTVKIDSVIDGWAKIIAPVEGYCKDEFLK